jgi:hypothetical protein
MILGMDDEAAEFLAQDVVTLRASGKSVREIARLLGCARREVDEALDEHAKRCLTPQNRARLIGSELATLDAMSEPFIKLAKAGDAQAAIVVLKIQTRRSLLLGLDAPIRHDPIELIASSEPKLNSTEHYRTLLDNVLGITFRERQLIDKHDFEGDDSPETIAELNALRAARGKPPLEEKASADAD